MPSHAPKDDEAKARILARLRSTQGHVRAVLDMVETDAYCIDVLQQTTAIRAAIAKVERMLLERHLHHCVADAVRSKSPAERERALGELLEAFESVRKP
jgi:DNA-binding FrmR family transcriptional regulator